MARGPSDDAQGQPPAVHRNSAYHEGHPLVTTRLGLRDLDRLHRVLRRRQQSVHDFLLDAVQWAESARETPATLLRVNFPREYAVIGARLTASNVDRWLELGVAAKAAGDLLDARWFRLAAGREQDALSFFNTVVDRYARLAAHADPATDSTEPLREN